MGHQMKKLKAEQGLSALTWSADNTLLSLIIQNFDTSLPQGGVWRFGAWPGRFRERTPLCQNRLTLTSSPAWEALAF